MIAPFVDLSLLGPPATFLEPPDEPNYRYTISSFREANDEGIVDVTTCPPHHIRDLM